MTGHMSQSKRMPVLTKLGGAFLDVDDGSFGGHVVDGTPGGERALAGVELLGEELLQLHANLDEVRSGGARDDHLEDVPLQVSMDEDLAAGKEQKAVSSGAAAEMEHHP